jgi:hypothetical protein
MESSTSWPIPRRAVPRVSSAASELELCYNRIEVPADPGLMIVAYTAEPGSRSDEALGLLASWAATEEGQEAESGVASAD